MFSFIIVTITITLVVAVENTTTIEEEYDYYDNMDPPLCQEKGGRLSKYFIDNFVLSEVNTLRARILAGNMSNGDDDERYPKGRYMYQVEWSCTLERYAIKFLGENCSEIIPPAPLNYTGLYYRRNSKNDTPIISAAFFDWREQHQHKLPRKYLRGKAVKYSGSRRLHELLNLARASTKKIGCAETLCTKGGVNKYKAFCLTDQPQLVRNEKIYEIGQGGCPTEKCPKGSECTSSGLCKWKREKKSTIPPTTSTSTPSSTTPHTPTRSPPSKIPTPPGYVPSLQIGILLVFFFVC